MQLEPFSRGERVERLWIVDSSKEKKETTRGKLLAFLLPGRSQAPLGTNTYSVLRQGRLNMGVTAHQCLPRLMHHPLPRTIHLHHDGVLAKLGGKHTSADFPSRASNRHDYGRREGPRRTRYLDKALRRLGASYSKHPLRVRRSGQRGEPQYPTHRPETA